MEQDKIYSQQYLVTTGRDCRIRVWDLNKLEWANETNEVKEFQYRKFNDSEIIWTCEYLSNNPKKDEDYREKESIIISGGISKQIKAWNIQKNC